MRLNSSSRKRVPGVATASNMEHRSGGCMSSKLRRLKLSVTSRRNKPHKASAPAR